MEDGPGHQWVFIPESIQKEMGGKYAICCQSCWEKGPRRLAKIMLDHLHTVRAGRPFTKGKL